MSKTNVYRIFKVTKDKHHAICPPSQVFNMAEFEYLFDFGGGLVEDEDEYKRFIGLLKELGEVEFYIYENIGATITSRNQPFETTISVEDSYDIFKGKVETFDPPFGWTINHFFIYGQKANWGIYMCEYPTVNIIGCDRRISNKFHQVFSINERKSKELRSLIKNEYSHRPELMAEFTRQYKYDN